jgi:hypothetical protein
MKGISRRVHLLPLAPVHDSFGIVRPFCLRYCLALLFTVSSGPFANGTDAATTLWEGASRRQMSDVVLCVKQQSDGPYLGLEHVDNLPRRPQNHRNTPHYERPVKIYN